MRLFDRLFNRDSNGEDITLNDAVSDLTDDFIQQIEASSIKTSQLSEDIYTRDNVQEEIQKALEQEDYSCVQCGRRYDEFEDFGDEFYIVWNTPPEQGDNIEELIEADNIEPICGDCHTGSNTQKITSVKKSVPLSERAKKTYSTLERLSKIYTPSTFIQNNLNLLVFLYVALGGVYYYFTDSVVGAVGYPLVLLLEASSQYPLVLYGVVVPFIAGLYTIFEHYQPPWVFSSNLIRPQERLLYISTFVIGSVAAVVSTLSFLAYLSIIPSYGFTLAELQDIALYAGGFTTLVASPVAWYGIHKMISHDRQTIIARDLKNKTRSYITDVIGDTRPLPGGGTEPNVLTEYHVEAIEQLKDRKSEFVGYAYNTTFWRFLANVGIAYVITSVLVSSTYTSGVTIYGLPAFALPIIGLLYYVYRYTQYAKV